MQLDFLTKLTSWLEKPAPQLPPPTTTTPQPPAAPKPVQSAKPKNTDAALTAEARALLEELGCTELAARVRVRWNSRMRSTAGLANYAHSLITMNPRLAEFGDEEIDRTLRHELAHLLAHHRAGRRRIAPHGAEWKQACGDLGLSDEKRCHDLPLPRRKITAKHTYRCPSCRVDIHRVRPFRRRVACLACCRAYNRGVYDDKFRLVKVPFGDQ